MKFYKNKIIAMLPIAALICSSTVFANLDIKKDIDEKLANKEHVNHVTLLFYQHAEKARVSKNKEQSGCYQIDMQHSLPTVTYFSNYPEHQSGQMSLTRFTSSWQHAEKNGIKPNAVLTGYSSPSLLEKHMVNAVIRLELKQYDSKTKIMTYLACPLNGKIAFSSPTLYHVGLFIDPIHRWPP